jgi:ABC-type nitrate/sulfonate/bicarbonate transport system permease component
LTPSISATTSTAKALPNRAYYDVARTLGASNRFLILKVAIPAALPHVFVGRRGWRRPPILAPIAGTSRGRP